MIPLIPSGKSLPQDCDVVMQWLPFQIGTRRDPELSYAKEEANERFLHLYYYIIKFYDKIYLNAPRMTSIISRIPIEVFFL